MKQPEAVSIWPLFTDLSLNVMGIFVALYVVEFIKQKSEGLRTYAIDLVIVLDGTGSMGAVLTALVSALASMIEVVALAAGFQVGLVVYREKIDAVQPLTTVASTDADATLDRLRTVDLIRGAARLDAGIEAGIETLGTPAAGRRQILLVCGDVDCAESAIIDDRSQNDIEDGLIERLTVWAAERGSDRRVVSVWAGGGDGNDFFERLSRVNDNSVYCTDTSRMFLAMCKAALSKEPRP